MENKHTKRFQNGFGLLEILLVAIIIFILCYFALKAYIKTPSIDKQTQKTLSEQGIDASSHKAVLDSSRERIKDVEKQLFDREKQLETIKY